VVTVLKKCPVCGKGNLRRGVIDEEMFGLSLGRYQAEICEACGESFLDTSAIEKIEKKAKELGIRGLAKKVTVRRSGNSLVVRIPSELVKFVGLKEGVEALLHPEGKNKLIVEIA